VEPEILYDTHTYMVVKKSDIPTVFQFQHSLHALYLQFLFTHVSLALNDVITRWRFGSVGNVVQTKLIDAGPG